LTTTDVMRAALEGSPRRTAVEQPSNGGARSDTRQQAPVPRPTLIELKDALATAELRYFDSEDPRALGKVLLYLHARSEKLDRVRHLAERLLAAGLDSQVHGQLVRALEDLALFDAQGPGAAPEPFGLEPSEAGERAASH
ncbi:MAG TPA: hypothetical protein VLT59_12610, partial [Steroidobacteraceae bacterium]|nr:hypothetical protein [Steroidobacteraceae bacterium]